MTLVSFLVMVFFIIIPAVSISGLIGYLITCFYREIRNPSYECVLQAHWIMFLKKYNSYLLYFLFRFFIIIPSVNSSKGFYCPANIIFRW